MARERKGDANELFGVALLVMVLVFVIGFAVVMYIQGKIFVVQNIVSSTIGEDPDNRLRAMLLRECDFNGQEMTLYQALSVVVSDLTGDPPPGYEVPSNLQISSCIEGALSTITDNKLKGVVYVLTVTNKTGHTVSRNLFSFWFVRSRDPLLSYSTESVLYESKYPLISYRGDLYWVVLRKEKVREGQTTGVPAGP